MSQVEKHLRICQIPDGVKDYPPAGANTSTWETHRVASAISRLGHSNHVITCASTNDSYPYTISNVRLGLTKNDYINKILFGLYLYGTIEKYVKTGRYDIINYHAPIPASFGTARLRATVPSIITWGDPFIGGSDAPKKLSDTISQARGFGKMVHRISLFFQSYTMKHITRIIAVSATQKNRISYLFGVPPSKIDVIPPGVDIDRFCPDLETADLRLQHGLQPQTETIVCPARITPIKSQLTLILSLPMMKDIHNNLKVLFVGQISDRQYFSELISVAKKLHVEQDIIFTDTVSEFDFPRYYNLADVVVLPSKGEGLPSSLIEAMSCAKPIVASNIPSNRDVVVSGNGIVFVPKSDIPSYIEAISSFLSDKELRTKAGIANRMTVISNYSWKRVAEMTVKSYRKATE